MKNIKSLFIIALVALTITSCTDFKAKRQISKLESLTEKVETKGDRFDQDDWKDVAVQYEQICENMLEYEYTNDQWIEIGKLQGRFYAACATYGVKQVGEVVNGYLHQAAGAIGGFLEGVSKSVETSPEAKEMEDQLEESLQELNNLFE